MLPEELQVKHLSYGNMLVQSFEYSNEKSNQPTFDITTKTGQLIFTHMIIGNESIPF